MIVIWTRRLLPRRGRATRLLLFAAGALGLAIGADLLRRNFRIKSVSLESRPGDGKRMRIRARSPHARRF